MKKLLIVIIIIVLAVVGLMYLGAPKATTTPPAGEIDQSADTTENIEADLGTIDANGSLEADFNSLDADINNL